MKKSYIVDNTYNDVRLDKWIKKNISNLPQALIEKNIRKGKIKLNNKKTKSSQKVKTNDKIYFYNFRFIEKKVDKNSKFNPSKNIIRENENLIIDNNENFVVINKKSGISVQGGTKSKKNIIDIFSKSKIFFETKPFSVHRLDKETSGIFLMAKNRETAQLLTTLFRIRKIHKTYLAICQGEILKNSGELNHDLIKYENNKKIIEKARTIYKVIDKNSFSTLVELKPITGRKHQIRKQLYEIGHPIYGDRKYNILNFKSTFKMNLMLHSFQIKFIINNNKYSYKALLPDHFKKFLKSKRLSF